MTGGDVQAFHCLGDAVRSALSARGFDTPTAPQEAAIPPVSAGEHTLVIAPTGTGKTETAMLPVFDQLQREPPIGFGALYITPLRALNRDILDRLEWWGETLDLTVDVRHGDTSQYQRGKQASDPPDILITTPETVQAMLTGQRLREGLRDVSHVIVDEVHELAASKRGAQLAIGLERLAALAGSFQRIGLSATVGDPAEVASFLTGDRPCTIREIQSGTNLSVTVESPDTTEADERLASRLLTDPSMASQIRTIKSIIEENDSTLLFVNTRQTAEALGSRLKELDVAIGVHHGSLSKGERIDVEDRFKHGDLDALLCTSSMELGIDVGRIDHVIQYQSPRQVSRLVQRIGRAGHRSDQISKGTIITSRPDDTVEALAIARRAGDGLVEPADIHTGSLDVIANQIAGMVQSRDTVGINTIVSTINQAVPFRDVDEETIRSVIDELHRNRIVWFDESDDTLSTTGSTWQYVYSNLSMIHDEETYDVYDIASARSIGTLDERFVVNFARPGEVFVQRGDMWRISEVDEEEDRVKVSPIEDPTGEVPSWIGEEIPVPQPVAREVGRIRETAEHDLQCGGSVDEVSRELTATYPGGRHTITDGIEPVTRHVESDLPTPTADRIVIEQSGRTVIVNTCVGHKTNETVGRLLSALLGQQSGSSIGMDTDPYRIELEVPSSISYIEIESVLFDTDTEHIKPLLELGLKRSDTLAFRLSQVATKFGALKRWEGSGRFSNERLLKALEGTPMYREAIREIFHDDLDIDGAKGLLEAIQQGEVELVTISERTPIGSGGFRSGTELLTPENADASVINTVKERIMDDEIRLVCTHCADWDVKTAVKRVRQQPRCPECESTRVAALSPWADEVVQSIQSEEKDEDQSEMTRRAVRNAGLVQSHGKQAVIALSGRGVGPVHAARILAKLRETEEEFYRDILVREREYARTRAFWD